MLTRLVIWCYLVTLGLSLLLEAPPPLAIAP
jgi:hypothetical protein